MEVHRSRAECFRTPTNTQRNCPVSPGITEQRTGWQTSRPPECSVDRTLVLVDTPDASSRPTSLSR
jgi:hypothetical protein